MLFRFCLYGFLKNQRYFEPFLILAFRQKDLAFATIGLLIAFREICVVVMEIPTGAVADALGRRRAMIASFVAYVGAFVFWWSWKVALAVGVVGLSGAAITGQYFPLIQQYGIALGWIDVLTSRVKESAQWGKGHRT